MYHISLIYTDLKLLPMNMFKIFSAFQVTFQHEDIFIPINKHAKLNFWVVALLLTSFVIETMDVNFEEADEI